MTSIGDILEKAEQAQGKRPGDDRPRKDRPPLVWGDVHEVPKGDVKVVVSAAPAGRFSFYSIRIGRADRPTPNIGIRTTPPTLTTPSTVQDPGIATDIAMAVTEAFAWINARLESDHAAKVHTMNYFDEKKNSKSGPSEPRKTGKTERDRQKKARKKE